MKMLIAGLLMFSTAAAHAKPPIPTPIDTPVVGPWDAYLLKTLYATDDVDTGLKSVVDTKPFKSLIAEQGITLPGRSDAGLRDREQRPRLGPHGRARPSGGCRRGRWCQGTNLRRCA